MGSGFSRYLFFLLLPLLLLPGIASAQDDLAFEAGLAARKAGDYAKALSIWKPLAKEGHPRALYYIGRLQARGQGLDADPAQAITWYKWAAERGHPQAQALLGMEYWRIGDQAKAECQLSQAAGAGARVAGGTLSVILMTSGDRVDALLWARVELENDQLGRDKDANTHMALMARDTATVNIEDLEAALSQAERQRANQLFTAFMERRRQGRFTDLPSDRCEATPVS